MASLTFATTNYARVKKLLLLIFCGWLLPLFLCAQAGSDSGVKTQDSPRALPPPPRPKDSVARKPTLDTTSFVRIDSVAVKDSLSQKTSDTPHGIYQFIEVLRSHPYYKFYGPKMQMMMQEKQGRRPEPFFYLIIGLFFYYGLIRVIFPKYMNDLFTLFFRATLRQQQLREQLLQNPFPSLLLNILFLLSGSLYSALLARYYNILPQVDFWVLGFYCLLILAAVYVGKFLVLKTIGWILRISKATDSYLFVVFMANKMAGIFLLPVLLMLAFPFPPIVSSVIALSLFVLALLLGYRFFVSYRLVRNEIKLNLFHFFLYLCAFEIAPLLLVYKALLTFVETF